MPEIAEALKPILQAGLPVRHDYADMTLLGLRGVFARSIDPDQPESRIKALDGLIRRLLAYYPDDALGEPARILFGMASGTRGAKITARREAAARQASYDADHFRRHIEPRILEGLAWQLNLDSQNYISREREAPPLVDVSGDTPHISEGDIATKDASEHQEALSRLWAAVYGLRADILQAERLKVWPYDETEQELSMAKLVEARKSRASSLRRVKTQVRDYLDKYGERIEHGGAEYDVRGLLRLSGWAGDNVDR